MSPRKKRIRRSRKRADKSSRKSASKNTSKKSVRLIVGLAVVAVIIVVVGIYYMSGSGENGLSPVTVAFGTTMGDIVIELRGDMPILQVISRIWLNKGCMMARFFTESLMTL